MLRYSLLLAFFVSGLPDVLGVNCPYGWAQYGGLCYRYIGYHSYANGVTACKSLGGRMFEPRSEALNNYLKAIFNFNYVKSIWIGINNYKYESDGQPITYSSPFYQGGYAYMQNNGYWYSEDCPDVTKGVYCEAPSANTDCASPATIFVEDSFPSINSGTCMAACAATEGCVFWIYTTGSCGLRFYEAGDVAGGGVPYQTQTGFPHYIIPATGRVIVGRLEKNVGTAAECQKMCAEDPKCNSFTWTNTDLVFYVNTQTCIFNYGKTIRTLTLPTPSGFQVISGPPCCNPKDACGTGHETQVDVSVTTGHYPLRVEDLAEAFEQQEAFIQSISQNTSSSYYYYSTTKGVYYDQKMGNDTTPLPVTVKTKRGGKRPDKNEDPTTKAPTNEEPAGNRADIPTMDEMYAPEEPAGNRADIPTMDEMYAPEEPAGNRADIPAMDEEEEMNMIEYF